jgi:hypothetical protein
LRQYHCFDDGDDNATAKEGQNAGIEEYGEAGWGDLPMVLWIPGSDGYIRKGGVSETWAHQ